MEEAMQTDADKPERNEIVAGKNRRERTMKNAKYSNPRTDPFTFRDDPEKAKKARKRPE
jgi:hypothetical protein